MIHSQPKKMFKYKPSSSRKYFQMILDFHLPFIPNRGKVSGLKCKLFNRKRGQRRKTKSLTSYSEFSTRTLEQLFHKRDSQVKTHVKSASTQQGVGKTKLEQSEGYLILPPS